MRLSDIVAAGTARESVLVGSAGIVLGAARARKP
jgi:hypothetical protein